MGGYIYYTQIFDFVYAVAKKGDFDVVVAVFVITIMVCSFEYLRLSLDSPPKNVLQIVVDFCFVSLFNRR